MTWAGVILAAAVLGQADSAAVPADLPSLPTLPGKYQAVAVLPFAGIDVDDELVRAVEVALLREIDQLKRKRAVSPQDVLSDLQSVGLSASCDGDTACVARAGRYARAHRAVEVKLAGIAGTINLSLRLVDTVKATELGRAADTIPLDATERATQIFRMTRKLLSPETYVGSLSIQCDVDGADVYLDDKLVGQTPLKKPLARITAGPHILRISKTGYTDIYRFVDVIYRRSSKVAVDLDSATIAGIIVEEQSDKGYGSLFIASADPDVEIRIDGEPRATTPLDGPIEKVAAGKRQVQLIKEGLEPAVQELDIEKGQRTDVAITASATGLTIMAVAVVPPTTELPEPPKTATPETVAAIAPGPDAPPVDTTDWRLPTGLVIGGLGVAGIIAGTVLGSIVKKNNDEATDIFNDSQSSGGLPTAEWESRQARLDTLNDKTPPLQTGQFIAFGAGAGLAAIGIFLAVWDIVDEPVPEATAAEPGYTVEAAVAPTSGGAFFTLTVTP